MLTGIFYRVGTVEIKVYINCGGSRKRHVPKIPGGSLGGGGSLSGPLLPDASNQGTAADDYRTTTIYDGSPSGQFSQIVHQELQRQIFRLVRNPL